MSEFKFKLSLQGKELIIMFRANEKLDAYAQAKTIAHKLGSVICERIYDDEK